MNQQPSTPEHLTALREQILARCNDEELRTLCADLGVDYDDLPAIGRANKARELVAFLERRHRLPELEAVLARPRSLASRIRHVLDGDQQRAMRNRQAMLQLVHNTWVKGVLEQSLHGAAMIELGLEEKAEAVEHPWDMVVQRPEQPDCTLPPGTKIINTFDEMNCALLILGEPGSGKTTMLLELARDTIARAQVDPTQPMPVVFNLSSWAEKRQPLVNWLVEELNTKYNIPKRVAQPWVENDELMLLLDGLDEVKLEYREACVQAINEFRQEHGLAPLVVCSRCADYAALTTRLKLQGAVLLQPLTPEQIDQHLANMGDELVAVHSSLQHDSSLQELAQSPLMLSIMTLAYRGISAQDLQAPDTAEARHKHLFDVYILRMFERRGADWRYTPEQTTKWLTWLAQEMSEHAQSEFFVELLQQGWLQTDAQRRLHTVVAGLAGGLTFGLPVGLTFGLAFGEAVGLARGLTIGLAFGLTAGLAGTLAFWGLAAGLTFGLTFGLTIGLAAGLATGLAAGLAFGPTVGLTFGLIALLAGLAFGLPSRLFTDRNKIRVIETLSWSWSKAVLGLAIGLAFGLVGGLVAELIARLAGGLRLGLFAGLFVGLIFGILRGLAGGEVEIEKRITPNQGIRQSARNAIRVGAIVGLSGGLLVGFVRLTMGYIQIGGMRIGSPADGLALGMMVGLATGLTFGGIACIQHLVLRFLLSRTGCLPWNLVRFLDYCAERIFLRKVGGGYIFVHRALMEYFASLDDTVKAT